MKPFAPDERIDLALQVALVALAVDEEGRADDERLARRQVTPRRDEPLEEPALGAKEEARAVARVLEAATPVLHAADGLERELDQLVARAGHEVGEGDDAASPATGMLADGLTASGKGVGGAHGAAR